MKQFWSLEHQYSIEESRHIIATSFPHHFHVIWVDGPTLEAQEWHFCTSEWQSGSFVNMSGRVKWPRELGLTSCTSRTTSSSTFLQPPFSFSKLPWWCPLRFFTFLAHFYRFYAYLTAPIKGFTFWIRFLARAAHFVISLTWNNTHSWGFHIYIS